MPKLDSNDSKSKKPASEKRLLPRLTVSFEQFKLASNGKLFSVADLSFKGMALRVGDREDLYLFSVGASVFGTLNLRRMKYTIEGRVRHVGRDLVGIEFTALSEEVEAALKRMLDPVSLGEELKPIPTGDLSIWYCGPSGSEFLINRDVNSERDSRATRLTVVALGCLIVWDEHRGLSTGVVKSSFEESQVQGTARFETMLYEQDSAIDSQKIEIARTLIHHSSLQSDLKKWALRHLEII
jgi:hypothetical protein